MDANTMEQFWMGYVIEVAARLIAWTFPLFVYETDSHLPDRTILKTGDGMAFDILAVAPPDPAIDLTVAIRPEPLHLPGESSE